MEDYTNPAGVNDDLAQRQYRIDPRVRAKASFCIVADVWHTYRSNASECMTEDLYNRMLNLIDQRTSDPNWKYSAQKLLRSGEPKKCNSVVPESPENFAIAKCGKGLLEIGDDRITVKKIDGRIKNIIPIISDSMRKFFVGSAKECDRQIKATNEEMREYLRQTLTPETFRSAIAYLERRDEADVSALFDKLGWRRESVEKFVHRYPMTNRR